MHEQQTTECYTGSGVCRLRCPDCKKAYVGQTGEVSKYDLMNTDTHSRPTVIRQNFAQHLIKHNHSFDNIHNTIQVLQHHRKGPHLNTLERFHTYAEYITHSHRNDNRTIYPNKIFDVLLKPDHSRAQPPTHSSP
jgi:hypothetical protein